MDNIFGLINELKTDEPDKTFDELLEFTYNSTICAGILDYKEFLDAYKQVVIELENYKIQLDTISLFHNEDNINQILNFINAIGMNKFVNLFLIFDFLMVKENIINNMLMYFLIYFNFNEDKFKQYENKIGEKLSQFFGAKIFPDLLYFINNYSNRLNYIKLTKSIKNNQNEKIIFDYINKLDGEIKHNYYEINAEKYKFIDRFYSENRNNNNYYDDDDYYDNDDDYYEDLHKKYNESVEKKILEHNNKIIMSKKLENFDYLEKLENQEKYSIITVEKIDKLLEKFSYPLIPNYYEEKILKIIENFEHNISSYKNYMIEYKEKFTKLNVEPFDKNLISNLLILLNNFEPYDNGLDDNQPYYLYHLLNIKNVYKKIYIWDKIYDKSKEYYQSENNKSILENLELACLCNNFDLVTSIIDCFELENIKCPSTCFYNKLHINEQIKNYLYELNVLKYSGGLLDLIAYGAQDVYLTGNPNVTYTVKYNKTQKYTFNNKKNKNQNFNKNKNFNKNYNKKINKFRYR